MARTSSSRGAAPFRMKSSGDTTFKMMGSSPLTKPECSPGGGGCGGNFKVKKKGTVVSRSLRKFGSWISSEIKDIKGDIRRGKSNRKRRKGSKGVGSGSHGEARNLTSGHANQ